MPTPGKRPRRTNAQKGDGDCDDRITNDDATLHSFHHKVGAALDWWAATMEPDVPPWSYTEYCAYRAWHLVGSRRLPANMRWYYCHHEQKPSPDQSFLALFVLTLQVRDGLKMRSIVDDKKKKDDRIAWAEHARDAVSHFRSTMDRVPSATRLRYYRFFSMVKLHRVLYEFMPNCAGDDLITLATKILSECIGPLCLGLIADKRLEESQWVVIAEIFKQAILGSEAVRNDNGLLHQSEANPEDEFSSDCIIETFSKILTKSVATRPPSECVENAAKVRENIDYHVDAFSSTSMMERSHEFPSFLLAPSVSQCDRQKAPRARGEYRCARSATPFREASHSRSTMSIRRFIERAKDLESTSFSFDDVFVAGPERRIGHYDCVGSSL